MEVSEHTDEIEIRSEETATLVHNENVMICTPTATKVSLPAMPDDFNTSNTIDETHDAQHEIKISNPSVTMHPAVSSGDFDHMVHLKTEKELTDSETFYLHT